MSIARRVFAPLVAASLATLVPAPRASALTLKIPRFEVPPRSDREVCTFVRLPRKKAMDFGGSIVTNVGGNLTFTSHHFLMWAYTGSDLDGFGERGTLVDSKACIDFGPADSNQRILIAGSQTRKQLQRLPRHVVQRINPVKGRGGQPEAIGIILNTHWINGSDKPQSGSVKIKLLPRRGKVKRELQPIFEVVANGFIRVPPGQTKSVEWAWRPGGSAFNVGGLGGGAVPNGPACVTMVTAHMHKRGQRFTVSYDGAAGEEAIYEALDYADPGQLLMDGIGPHRPPLLVRPGERLIYNCTHDNGVTTDVKMGCEEQPGVPPGKSVAETIFVAGGLGGAAKRCTLDADCPATDPAYPGRTFTGKCVPANLVFGFTSDDDMCILPGAYYDANPDAPPGRECDLSLM
jgi:hypothetical protein